MPNNEGNWDYSAMLDYYARDKNEIVEYRNFLIPKLPLLVQKCNSMISTRGSQRDDEKHFAAFLEILYNSVLLFYVLDLEDDWHEEEIQGLFGPSFDLKKDLEIQAKTMGFSVGETFFNAIERAVLRQHSITGGFKFQQVKPQLAFLIMKFQDDLKASQSTELASSCLVLYYLKNFIKRDPRSGILYEE